MTVARALAGGEAGVTLLEMAMALIVVGMLTMAALAAYRPAADASRLQRNVRQLEEIRAALLSFAATHHRLPCPDRDHDGLEDAACADVGWAPYGTLGISFAGAAGVAGAADVVYGVYRNQAASADLTVARERTGNASTVLPRWSADDFLRALANGAVAPYSATHVHVAGLDAVGKSDCRTSSNVAFALASSGAGDADGDGNPLDGVNSRLVGNAGFANVRCFASPARRSDAGYDDITLGVGFGEMAGALRSLAN